MRLWMGKSVLALAVVFATASLGIGVAAANVHPLVEAGLDQRVAEGSTVRLDAGGSFDPDGTIVQYAWRVETPNGTVRTPACADCEQTELRVPQNGTYTVTATATDDGGASGSDTFELTVFPKDPPTVEIRGFRLVLEGRQRQFTAMVEAGAERLTGLTWYRDGTRVAGGPLSGENATSSADIRFPEPGEHNVTAVAVDANGWVGRTVASVDVDGGGSESQLVWSSPDGLDGTDLVIVGDDEQLVNGDGETIIPSETTDRLEALDGVTVREDAEESRLLEVTNDAVQRELRQVTYGAGGTTRLDDDPAPGDGEFDQADGGPSGDAGAADGSRESGRSPGDSAGAGGDDQTAMESWQSRNG